MVIKHTSSYHLVGSLCLCSEGKHWRPLWEFLPCRKIMYSMLYRKLLWCVHMGIYAPRILVKLIKWLLSSCIKDSHSFDSPNSSSFISGHCCQLVLEENSLTVMLLPGGRFPRREDRTFFDSIHLLGHHVLSRCNIDMICLSPGFLYSIL